MYKSAALLLLPCHSQRGNGLNFLLLHMPNTRHTCPSTRLICLIPGKTQPTIRGRAETTQNQRPQSETTHNQRPHRGHAQLEVAHRDRAQSEATHNLRNLLRNFLTIDLRPSSLNVWPRF